jgi:hypothetical protein
MMAVTWGTPMPATIRVVQMDPGPIPILTASTPASIKVLGPLAVATLPAMRSMSGKAALSDFTASMTFKECPWDVSMSSTSAPAFNSFSARSIVRTDTDGSTDPQAAQGCLCRRWGTF